MLLFPRGFSGEQKNLKKLEKNMYSCYKEIFVLVTFMNIFHSFCVDCTNSRYGTTIHKIYGLQEFLDNIFFCHNSESKIITYQECHIPRVLLPMDKIKKNFPSLHLLNWRCTGDCYVYVKDMNVKFRGCVIGKINSFKSIFTLFKIGIP